jgi:GH25 family lysozyme M1 (1,4-beta-N-acetylmuramidase)
LWLAAEGSGVEPVQPEAEGSPEPSPSTSPDGTDADIAPDVLTPPETREQGQERGLISGIDVSHHNGDIDYGRVRSAGNAFVIIKATQDNDFIDPMFLTNMARARAAGLAAGGYHFFDYTLDGTAQADHFLDRLDLAGAIDDALPPVVDVECWAPIGSSIHAVSTARLRDFVARVYERTGRLPIVYTSVFMWRQVVGNADGFEDLPLWTACWGCDAPPSIAPGWDGWTFWQTGVNRIPRVGRLDGNFFSGSPDDLEALRLRPFSIEAGAPATASSLVELDLGGRDATHMRTSADGLAWSEWRPIRGEARAILGPEEGSQTLHVELRNGPTLRSGVYLDSISLDRSGPEVSAPEVRLLEAPHGSDAAGAAMIPVEVAWQAVDATAGLSDAAVSVSCDDVATSQSEAPLHAVPGESAAATAAVMVVPTGSCDLTVVSRDGVGNATSATGGPVEADFVSLGGSGALSALVEGDQVGVVATRGPDGGRAAVLVDGTAVGLIDLYQPIASGPETVYVAGLEPGIEQLISVEATGTSDPASSGSSVVIDGFVTLTSG